MRAFRRKVDQVQFNSNLRRIFALLTLNCAISYQTKSYVENMKNTWNLYSMNLKKKEHINFILKYFSTMFYGLKPLRL